MRVAIGLVCLFATLAGGCATTDSVNDAGAVGAKRVYQYPYETVFNAAVAAAKAKKLEVVATDAKAGTVTLSNSSGTWQNWGQNVAIQVKPLTSDFTEVAIVNAPRFDFITYSPSWQRILQEQIDRELRSGAEPEPRPGAESEPQPSAEPAPKP